MRTADRSTPRRLDPRLLLFAAALGAAAAALALLPVQQAALLSGAVVALLLLIVLLARPTLFLALLILTSPLAGLIRAVESISLSGSAVTLSGARWLAVAAVATLLLIAQARRAVVPLPHLLLILLSLWMGLRLVMTGVTVSGLKDVLFYLLGPLVGVTALAIARGQRRDLLRWVEGSFLATVLIPPLLYLVTIPAGLVRLTPNGPKGVIGSRPLAGFLLLALVVCLALARHGERRRLATVLAALATATIAFTFSRMSMVLAVIVVVGSRVRVARPSRLIVRGVIAVGLAVIVVLLFPPLSRRTLGDRSIDEIGDLVRIDLSGRDVFWSATVDSALERPFFGAGPGSARRAVGKEIDRFKEYFPHNEYLQIWHDGGLVGLALCVLAWGLLLVRSWRVWRSGLAAADRARAQWGLSALWTTLLLVLSAIVDNTFHYAHLMVPGFIILACADVVAAEPGESLMVAGK